MESQAMTATDLTIIDLVAPVLPSQQSNQPAKSNLELRQACFNAVVREYNPTGFAETMLAREIARCAAQMVRDEQLLDAAETQLQQSLLHVVVAAADAAATASPLLSIAQIC